MCRQIDREREGGWGGGVEETDRNRNRETDRQTDRQTEPSYHFATDESVPTDHARLITDL